VYLPVRAFAAGCSKKNSSQSRAGEPEIATRAASAVVASSAGSKSRVEGAALARIFGSAQRRSGCRNGLGKAQAVLRKPPSGCKVIMVASPVRLCSCASHTRHTHVPCWRALAKTVLKWRLSPLDDDRALVRMRPLFEK